MKRHSDVTFIQAAIPAQRGAAKHVERFDDVAQTVFNTKGEVTEVHTTQDAFRRLHEVLHARHTQPGSYKGRRHEIREIIEDCRLHLTKWPWKDDVTPEVIADDVDDMFKFERKRRDAALKAGNKIEPFSNFAQQLRQNATYMGMGKPRKVKKFRTGPSAGFGRSKDQAYDDLANRLLQLIRQGRHEEAAAIMEAAFFYDEDKDKPKPERKPKSEGDDEGENGDTVEGEDGDEEGVNWNSGDIPTMITTELPFTEPTDHADRGFRMATSGARIYRPALRRPVLPQRLFIKQAPIAPGGSIVFDASGSMGVSQERLLDCCERAPAATVAFYSGDDSPQGEGDLYVFAKDGMRATNINSCNMRGGNGVDGQALDWLLAQESPRIFVTDRGFCGSGDSMVQLARLAILEDLGEVTVYESYDKFQEDHPPLVKQAA